MPTATLPYAPITTLYLPYDTSKDFAFQCNQNLEVLCELLLKQFGIKVPTQEEILKIMEENEQ